MAEELFTRPKQGFASRGDVRKKSDPEVKEKDMAEAPVWYDTTEASAWASGYNAALTDLGLLS